VLINSDATGKAIIRVRPRWSERGPGTTDPMGMGGMGMGGMGGMGGDSYRIDVSDFIHSTVAGGSAGASASASAARARPHQADALALALQDGLTAACSLGLNGLAVVAPTALAGGDDNTPVGLGLPLTAGGGFLSALTGDHVRSATVEACVRFAVQTEVAHPTLKKIVCVDLTGRRDTHIPHTHTHTLPLPLPVPAYIHPVSDRFAHY
jgi:hypothetical protein